MPIDKLAQTIGSASVVSTMLFSIWIGSMSISSILSAVAMLPSIIFVIELDSRQRKETKRPCAIGQKSVSY